MFTDQGSKLAKPSSGHMAKTDMPESGQELLRHQSSCPKLVAQLRQRLDNIRLLPVLVAQVLSRHLRFSMTWLEAIGHLAM